MCGPHLSPPTSMSQGVIQGTIPYLGTFLTDLVMLDTAMKDYLYVSELGAGRGGAGPEARGESAPQRALSSQPCRGSCPSHQWVTSSPSGCGAQSGRRVLAKLHTATPSSRAHGQRGHTLQGQARGSRAGSSCPRTQLLHLSSEGWTKRSPQLPAPRMHPRSKLVCVPCPLVFAVGSAA